MIKKITVLVLSLLIIFGLAACDVQISTTDENGDETVISIDEALEKLSQKNLEEAPSDNTFLLAPAKGGDNSLYGYVNLKGEWVVEPAKKATVVFNENYGMYLNGYSSYEVVDRSGKVVFDYYGICQMAESNHLQNGMVACCLNTGYQQKYLYLDSEFKTAIKATGFPLVDWREYSDTDLFGFASPFSSDGLAVVMRKKNSDCDDYWCDPESAYVIDKNGKIIASLPAGLDPDASGVDNLGNIIVRNTEGLYGLCSKDGKSLIECKYRFLRHCEGSLYLICNDNGFWGFIDKNDNIVIQCLYQKAYPFSEGLAAVYDGSFWGFIDEKGNTVIDFVLDDVVAVKSNNIDANTCKGVLCENCAIVSKNGYWGVVDRNGTPIACFSPRQCEGLDGSPFTGIQNGLITYRQSVDGNVLYGVMNTAGQIVLKPQFEYLGQFN